MDLFKCSHFKPVGHPNPGMPKIMRTIITKVFFFLVYISESRGLSFSCLEIVKWGPVCVRADADVAVLSYIKYQKWSKMSTEYYTVSAYSVLC